MRRPRFAVVCRAALLACAGGLAGCSLVQQVPPPVVYDLGPAPVQAASGALPLRVADVAGPPWLDDTGIAYRLLFRDPQRRERYRDSRWAAPPAALLAQRLRQQAVASGACAAATQAVPAPQPMLAVMLDDFEQVFPAAGTSHVAVRLRATMWLPAPGGGSAPVEREFLAQRAAPTPDAAGAARAFAQAVDALVPQVVGWAAGQVAPCR
jgi:cholesterol transport system auxiliary component